VIVESLLGCARLTERRYVKASSEVHTISLTSHARVLPKMYVITVTASSLLLNTAGARGPPVSYSIPFDSLGSVGHEIYNYTAARDVARNHILSSALRQLTENDCDCLRLPHSLRINPFTIRVPNNTRP